MIRAALLCLALALPNIASAEPLSAAMPGWRPKPKITG